MSLELYFLHHYLDFVTETMAAVSNEQGERFHHDISRIE